MPEIEQKIDLTILATSDLHGNVLPHNYGNNRMNEIGLAKVGTLIQKEQNHNEHTILIDNGDLIQGTPLVYYHANFENHSPNPMINLLNLLKYDVGVFGNHEFNFGKDYLKKAIDESKFPWLSANILNESTGKPFGGKPYLIKEIGPGIKVGILGLTTHYIPKWEKPEHISDLTFTEAINTAKKWVNVLRTVEKVDLLIVAYHGGFERELSSGEPTEQLTGENQAYRICTEIEGVDVLITGHQHRSIAGSLLNGVAIVQPGSQGSALGKVQITLKHTETDWKVINKSSALLSVNSVEPDSNIMSVIAPLERKTQQWLNKPVGKIKGEMRVKDPMDIRIQDNPLIEFFNKVQMDATNADISCTSLFNNESPGLPELVTMRDIVANYIYPNTLKVIRLSGQDIKDALEKSASYFDQFDGDSIKVNPEFVTPKPKHYDYDMWEGIEYIINVSRPIGKRITKLNYKDLPIDLNEKYNVVMNNYRASGGGDFTMFRNKPVILEVQVDVSELIAEYIKENGIVESIINNNWKVIHD